jgi:hypothetical protein
VDTPEEVLLALERAAPWTPDARAFAAV